MNYRSVFYVLGKIMNILALLMLLPLFVSFYYNMQGFKEAKYISFIIPIALLFLLGMILKCFKPSSVKIYAREGLVICGVGWILVSLFGSLPFIISGTIPNFVNAFLKQHQVLQQQVQQFLIKLNLYLSQFCFGAVLLIGLAVWVYFVFLLRLYLSRTVTRCML